MRKSPAKSLPSTSAEILDFGEAMINALAPHTRVELYTEASMLMDAFACTRQHPEALEDMAEALMSGTAHPGLGRAHARRLAAVLRLMAKSASPTEG